MDMNQLTKITLAWELYEQGLPKVHIAKRLGVHRETVGLWTTQIEKNPLGLEGFLDSYVKAKKGLRSKRQIDPILKRWIWELRERENDCCGQKIQYFLEKEHGVKPAVSKIYEVLAQKYVIKSRWKKNQARGPIPVAQRAREVIQVDSVDFGKVYAFTAIDIFTREADIILRPALTSWDAMIFLELCMRRRFGGHTELLQADGGPEFKNEFKRKALCYANRFRIARPYRKNEQSYIESFNRTVRKECLGWNKYHSSQIKELNPLVEEFLNNYHYHRPHLGLGLRPPLGS